MKKILPISFLGIILLVIVSLIALTYYYQFSLQKKSPAQYSINIEPGDNIVDISYQLGGQNIISSPFTFLIFSLSHSGRDKILPGIHTIPANSTIPDVFAFLQSDPNREIILTFPEGLTNQEIVAKIAENYPFSEDQLESELTVNNWKNKLPFLPSDEKFEGFLFPDTYRFAANSAPEEVIQRFINNFSLKWDEASKEKSLRNNLSDYEILTLASIIEKEANSGFEEKQIISGILLKRINEGIPLGANSTLNYILSDKKRVFSDFEINYPSEYNSYQNIGLPPTPICNPGLDSLQAAFNPKQTDYYYFLHTPAGETKYAKTYEEHLKNINKYL